MFKRYISLARHRFVGHQGVGVRKDRKYSLLCSEELGRKIVLLVDFVRKMCDESRYGSVGYRQNVKVVPLS